jgi:hypothetical protein
MQTYWRLAIMFDAVDGDHGQLARRLGAAAGVIRTVAAGNAVRIGTAIAVDDDQHGSAAHDAGAWKTVDGVVEVSIANGGEGAISSICREMQPVLESLSAPASIQVMAGETHFMVPVRPGNTFLSLAFRRYPGTTVADFRRWWQFQHGPLAIPVLGEELLAYDQVHVDRAMSAAAAVALGVPDFEYDAYDNLTFASREAFLKACSDVEGMMRIAEDEVGRIDDNTRRHALMLEI